jgi:hypothetical protein
MYTEKDLEFVASFSPHNGLYCFFWSDFYENECDAYHMKGMMDFLLNSDFVAKDGKATKAFPAMYMIKYGEYDIPYMWIKKGKLKMGDLSNSTLVDFANGIENKDKTLYDKITMHLWEMQCWSKTNI